MQYLLNISRENWVKVDALHADKNESLLESDAINFDGVGQACPKF